MGSVTFPGEEESQPSTSSGKSCKLSRMLLDGCDAVNHASIPRKLRSAMKKRGREFITSPLLVSKKQRQASTTVGTLKKDGAKKSKLNMKQGQHITKDEEEVAETLFALASFFADKNKAHQPGSQCEKPEIESSATLEEASAARDTCATPLKALNLLSLEAEEIKPQTLKTPQPNAHGGQSESSPHSSSRPLVSILGMNQNGEHEIHLDQVTTSGIQCRENSNSISDKYKGLFLSPNATGSTGSETHKSCPSAKIHTLFGSTNFSSQPRAIEKKVTAEKHTKVSPESNTSWKRCSAHVYISRLIEILQESDRKIESPLQPTQSTACEAKERESNGGAYFSCINFFSARKDSSDIQNHILLDKRHIQAQRMASETCSAKKEFDFLSLGTGLCGLDTGKGAGADGARCFQEPPQQFHMPYMQSQYSNSLSFHGHNSALAAQQAELQRQKWAAQLLAQYNKGGGGGPRLTDRRNEVVDSASVLNYAHSLFPRLHAALGPKYQHFSPSQQEVMAMNSNISRLRHNLPLGFERQNGANFRPENMAQLQHP